jgi:galactokinase
MPSQHVTYVDPGDPATIAAGLAAEVVSRTGAEPDVLAVAPGRVNLIGEHLDYNGGRVLPLALPHATYAALTRRDDRGLTVGSLQVDGLVEVAGEDLRPGGVQGWAAYVAGVVWAMREDGWDVPGVDVTVDSRVPIGSGLSSSAALECAVAVGLLSLLGVEDTAETRRRLVAACVRAENEMVGAPTGGMDQVAALLARPAHALLVDFGRGGAATTVPWDPVADGLTLLVVDTRVSHALSDGGYGSRRADCEAAAKSLGVSSLREVAGRSDVLDGIADERVRRRARHVLGEMARVDRALSLLEEHRYRDLGPLLLASHGSLRDDFEVSCPELDLVVDTAVEGGAVGARMTGGGFGGSAVVLVPEERVDAVTSAVVRAFAGAGFPTPGVLRAPASAGARLLP